MQIKIEFQTEATFTGYMSAVAFCLLPILEGFIFAAAIQSDRYTYSSGNSGAWSFLALVGMVHLATIPGMLFGRKLVGTVSRSDQSPVEPNSGN